MTYLNRCHFLNLLPCAAISSLRYRQAELMFAYSNFDILPAQEYRNIEHIIKFEPIDIAALIHKCVARVTRHINSNFIYSMHETEARFIGCVSW